MSQLEKLPPKIVGGFSDISSLHSALYAKLGWPSLHCPMPNTPYWNDGSQEGVRRTIEMLSQSSFAGSISFGRQEFIPGYTWHLIWRMLNGPHSSHRHTLYSQLFVRHIYSLKISVNLPREFSTMLEPMASFWNIRRRFCYRNGASCWFTGF